MLFHYTFGHSLTSKYYDTQLKSLHQPYETEIILMEPRHIAVLYRQRQIICVFLLENTKYHSLLFHKQELLIFSRPEYEFHFTQAEHVATACWSKNALYTLTDDGVLSKWILLTHGRKLRERYLKTELVDCFKILPIENDVSLKGFD
jgi:hypothetical protein